MLRHPLKALARMSQSRPTQDWQYVADVHRHLKAGDYNEALRSVIHSNLEGKVLDLQTFRNTHSRMLELKAEASYHELLYKLYREHFKPHPLMTDWMGYLAATGDAKTSQLLAADYQALKLEMPKPKIEEEKTPKPQKIEQAIATLNFSAPAIAPVGTGNQKEGQQSDIKHSIEPEEVKDFLSGFPGRYSKLVLHDLEITCETSLDSKNEEGSVEVTTSVDEIKIGKIEVFQKGNLNGNL